MYSVGAEWNPKQKELSRLLAKADTFYQGVLMCAEMHRSVHDLGKEAAKNVYQSLLVDMPPELISYRPETSFSSIAWNIWHITRIEDAISNIFLADSGQVFNQEWLKKINAGIADTGNAFTKEDVDEFGKAVNTEELLKYRKAVGMRTQKILLTLAETDRKRKPSKDQLHRIMAEKVLTEEKESIRLLDFWGGKTVSGLLTMPITRHQIVHINDCLKLKEKHRFRFYDRLQKEKSLVDGRMPNGNRIDAEFRRH